MVTQILFSIHVSTPFGAQGTLWFIMLALTQGCGGAQGHPLRDRVRIRINHSECSPTLSTNIYFSTYTPSVPWIPSLYHAPPLRHTGSSGIPVPAWHLGCLTPQSQGCQTVLGTLVVLCSTLSIAHSFFILPNRHQLFFLFAGCFQKSIPQHQKMNQFYFKSIVIF